MNPSSLQLLHDGANSLLYFQEDPSTSQSYVVKVMKEGTSVPNKVVAFYNEFEIAKALPIAGIPKYYRKDQIDGKPAIVIEHIDAQPLGLAFKGEKVAIGIAIDIFLKTAGILAEIHRHHIIHKDINANNILYNTITKEVTVIDFGISSKFDLRKQQLGSPDVLEGTLAYISPEQTGRMNRQVDYRTDLYSLGVTMYELLVGRLPFNVSDSMELVHCHLARRALPPCEADARIPVMLSEIVMKLMEKNASDRYQSAIGLHSDLEYCLMEWVSTGKVGLFELGEKDYSDRLQLSQKLYGCQDQIAMLMESFERVGQGGVELMLVKGYAGVGKSSLVNEVHSPITEKKGYFIHGKHDQYKRATPYAAFIQAFNDLVEQILTEGSDDIARWKSRILKGVGGNGAILIDVIPNLKLVIGQQPEVEKLAPAEAANRFNYVFRKFIEVISQKDHPLVIFLDDLQWADTATLNSLKMLMSDKQNQYLLIIGAFRSNEVDDTHPLNFAVDEMLAKGTTISLIELDNMKQAHVAALVADSLRCEASSSLGLSQLVFEKTQGNAFFVNQFLKSLYEEELLYFDMMVRRWAWDVAEIQKKNITNNVVELMASKIEKLPGHTRDVLQLAACIGDRFDLVMLSQIYKRNLSQTFNALWKAAEEGLIIPLDDNYKIIPALEDTADISINTHFQFLHDRVQQAAYQLLPEGEQKRLHFQIGREMMRTIPAEEQADKVFEIINQMNAGESLISDPIEKRRLADLNRMAAQKAKDATAYEASYDYLLASIGLLGNEGWSTEYESTLLAYIDLAETAYLVGKREEMEKYVSVILVKATDVLDKVRAYEVKAQAHTSNGEMKDAVATALKVLRLLGVRLPSNPNKGHVLLYLAKLTLSMRGRTSDSVLELPKMEDMRMRAAVRIMSATTIAAYFANKQLYALISIKQVLLSLKYGNAYTTPSAYASVALIFSGVLEKYEQGFFYGELALRLMKKRNAKKLEARIGMIFHSIVSPWKRHIGLGLESLKDGFQKGMDSGDFEYGLHSALEYVLCGIYSGRPLDMVFDTARKFYSSAKQVNQADPREILRVMCQALENLLNPEVGATSIFKGNYLNEDETLGEWVASDTHEAPLACAYALKYYLAVIFGEVEKADEYNHMGREYIHHVTGTVGLPILLFADSLYCSRAGLERGEGKKKIYIQRIKQNQKKFKKWMQKAPMNFEHRYWLVEAELAALTNKPGKASRYYKQAIHLAQENDFVNDEAVALERFAEFCIYQDNRLVGGLYLRKAYITYEKWGAKAKLVHMREHHYDLLLPEDVPDLTTKQIEIIDTAGRGTTLQTSSLHTTRRLNATSLYGSSSTGGVHALDFSSLLKASNALAQEVNMQQLQDKMLEITIENAGAQHGVFIGSEGDGQLIVNAIKIEGEAEIGHVGMPIAQSAYLPVSMVNYVARTQKPLVLADAAKDNTYAFDPYIKQRQPQSVMCFPVLNQGKLSGIIYLENNLINNAFTEDRLEVLNMLSAQMGIALENAALYNNLEKKVAERTAELHESNDELQEKNQKITDSIRYAQTIQAAMLPAESELESVFDDYFLLYRPKDIVSGDFYWMNRTDKAVYIAVADCTGHGVPGAFMSMIGASLLDEILIEKQVTDPAIMLELLHLGIRAGLRQDKTDNDDGMDVCLCAIEPLENGEVFKLHYAGAKRPLYYTKDSKLCSFKGSNKTIGGFLKRKESRFETFHDILAVGDMLFLTSDGYIDQSNKEQKKIGTELLLTLLEENAKYPMPKQKELLEKILDLHQEGVEQRDDITILGIQL